MKFYFPQKNSLLGLLTTPNWAFPSLYSKSILLKLSEIKKSFTILLHGNEHSVILGGAEFPESLVRVEELTGKKIQFHEADLCNKDSLRSVFSQVSKDVATVFHFKFVCPSFFSSLAPNWLCDSSGRSQSSRGVLCLTSQILWQQCHW